MKQFLLFSAFILFFLSPIFSFSQTYKIDEMRIYEWDDVPNPADWKHQSTNQFTYGNEGDKETNFLSLSMPGPVKSFQSIKTYNGLNNIKMDVSQLWNTVTMVWDNAGSTTYSYNSSNQLEIETFQSYNPVTMTWQDNIQILYGYDGNNLISETTQSYMSMAWVTTEMIEYGYDGSNNQNRETVQTYDYVGMMLVNSTQELTEYSGTDVTKVTDQVWVLGTGWVAEEIYELTYSSPGVITMSIDSIWDSVTSMWEIERGTAFYNGMGLIERVEFDVPDGLGGWDLISQTLFEYDGSLASIITEQDWVDPIFVNTDRERNTYVNGNNTVNILESWDISTSAWIPYFKVEFDFSLVMPFSLSTEMFNTETFKIFPNPVSDVLNLASSVSIEKIELFDILGKKVLSSSNTEQLNVESLKSGMYVLKVFSNNKSATKKVIIK